jgi:type III secretory pathway component EscT
MEYVIGTFIGIVVGLALWTIFTAGSIILQNIREDREARRSKTNHSL